MKIKYKQQHPVTLVSMLDDTLVGVSSCRPEDTFNLELGLAVAIIKASKRIPQKEMRWLDGLNGATWKTVTINQEAFGYMVQHMIGYRIACNGSAGGIEMTLGITDLLLSRLQPNADFNIGGATVKAPPPDCVIAERVGRELLRRFDLRQKMRF